eukprot:SAG11_NODE_357_length_10240_cov_4.621142_4_plen_121_part_00
MFKNTRWVLPMCILCVSQKKIGGKKVSSMRIKVDMGAYRSVGMPKIHRGTYRYALDIWTQNTAGLIPICIANPDRGGSIRRCVLCFAFFRYRCAKRIRDIYNTGGLVSTCELHRLLEHNP